MVIISITGTPGTGKSTLSRQLLNHFNSLDYYKTKKEESWILYDVTKIIKESKQFLKDIHGTYLIDVKKLNSLLIQKIHSDFSKNIIIDSFFSHELPVSLIELCIICTCDISELNKRLLKRDYSSSKIRENLDVEILDQCGQEAKESGHKVFYYNSSKDVLLDFVKKLDHYLNLDF